MTASPALHMLARPARVEYQAIDHGIDKLDDKSIISLTVRMGVGTPVASVEDPDFSIKEIRIQLDCLFTYQDPDPDLA